ncbi:MAG: hypothetical protein K0R13_3161 [Propionibacteriaceae bacterium]|jgi:succinate dehydrogenase/fumarate reductase flavoprotein subunit|nr:hypothetical protein [Propionibacteriaceae bacterium]
MLEEQYDVIVVGAGLAGLTAARDFGTPVSELWS